MKTLQVRPPTGRFKYILVIKRHGVEQERVTLRDPFDPYDMTYVVDSSTLEDDLLRIGWKPISIDVYTRICDRYGRVVIRAEANKLPEIGGYTFEILEEPNV